MYLLLGKSLSPEPRTSYVHSISRIHRDVQVHDCDGMYSVCTYIQQPMHTHPVLRIRTFTGREDDIRDLPSLPYTLCHRSHSPPISRTYATHQNNQVGYADLMG